MRYAVITPFGTFQRISARPYRFVVIACGRDEQFLRNRAASEATEYARSLGIMREAQRTGVMPRSRGRYRVSTVSKRSTRAGWRARAMGSG